MSDNGVGRPLTRRERRLLEMQEQGQQVDDAGVEKHLEAEVEVVQEASGAVDDFVIDETLIVIPSVDADGNPLSRREMRRLREEAIAELRAAHEADQAAVATEEPEAARVEDEDVDPEEAQAEVAGSDEVQPQEVEPEDIDLEEADPEDFEPEAIEVEDSTETNGDTPDATHTQENVELEPVSEPHDIPTQALSLEDLQEIEQDSVAEESDSTSEPLEAEEADPEADEQDEYSFPDIKPLAVDRPVFDDPSVRTVGTPGASSLGTGFDDMIERAVADETASVHSGTSSLILPTIPGSDDLSGAIGSTGELFITGSFELPKSIGETGGHSKYQESVDGEQREDEEDVVEMLNLTDMYETSEFDSAPVSASQAVSTRSLDKSGITTPEVQRDNKKSLILMGTGGGLILVLIGAGIWVAKSGLFG